jgi:hypothetical protein
VRATSQSQFLTTGIAILCLLEAPCFAASIASTVDGGGQRTASANYTMDGSVGGIGAVSVRILGTFLAAPCGAGGYSFTDAARCCCGAQAIARTPACSAMRSIAGRSERISGRKSLPAGIVVHAVGRSERCE